VFATATDLNQVLTLDEDTGAVLGRAPTGAYPDGLAYDPTRNQVWVTNESGGTQTVLDPATQAVLATVDVGGDAGNVAYDPGPSTPAGIGPGAPTQGGTSTPATGGPGRILVDVQSRNEVAVIDPDTHTVTRRVPVPGCQHPHGLTLDPAHRLGFIACDGNATVHTLDLDTLQVRDPVEVGADPDVLAFDHTTGWLYVAAESGTLTVLAEHDRHLQLLSRSALTDGAHVVAVDPATHDSYYPLAAGPGGHPELLIEHPSP